MLSVPGTAVHCSVAIGHTVTVQLPPTVPRGVTHRVRDGSRSTRSTVKGRPAADGASVANETEWPYQSLPTTSLVTAGRSTTTSGDSANRPFAATRARVRGPAPGTLTWVADFGAVATRVRLPAVTS